MFRDISQMKGINWVCRVTTRTVLLNCKTMIFQVFCIDFLDMCVYYSFLKCSETLAPSAEVIDNPSSSLHNLSSAALMPSSR